MLEQKQMDTMQEQLCVRFYKISRAFMQSYPGLNDEKLILQIAQAHYNEDSEEYTLGQTSPVSTWAKNFVKEQVDKRVTIISTSLENEFNYTPDSKALRKMALGLFVSDKEIL